MYNDKSIGEVCTEFYGETFFNLLYCFEISEAVRQFTVSDSGGTVTNLRFGYGKLKKWVTKFVFSKVR
jgi:hypothetical protein